MVNEAKNLRYVVHSKDLKEKDGTVYLPLYMVPLLVAKGFDGSNE